jgi:hypothetical protein
LGKWGTLPIGASGFFVFLAELSADPLFSAFRVEQTLVSCVEAVRGFSLVPTVA